MLAVGALWLGQLPEQYQFYGGMWVQAFLLFIFPAVGVELWWRKRYGTIGAWSLTHKRGALNEKRRGSSSLKTIVRGVLLLLSAFAASEFFTWVGGLMEPPAFFKEMEEFVTSQYDRLTNPEGTLAICLAWGATVVLAPFSEEFFFRGGLQGALLRSSKNDHLVVWVVALIFSAIHMQWSGLLTRLFLGLVLGYLALYGRLWWAILFHIFNNLMALLLSTGGGGDWLEQVRGSWWSIGLGLLGLCYLVALLIGEISRSGGQETGEVATFDDGMMND